MLAVPRAVPTPGSEAVCAAAQDSSKQSSNRSWGHLAQSCASCHKGDFAQAGLKRIRESSSSTKQQPRLCSSSSSYLLSQSSSLLCPDNSSHYSILPWNAGTLGIAYRCRVSTTSGAFRAHPSHNGNQHHTEQINKWAWFSEAGYSQQAGYH